MLLSVGLIILCGFYAGKVFQKVHLPNIIGMLLVGIVLGPYVCNVLDSSILSISSSIRKMALVIILIKAGLTLNIEDLKKAGRSAILLSFVPATFEWITYVLLAPKFFHITWIEAALMGAVLAAVSPAVVVPRMVQLIENGYGTNKTIPQMILAGASCDDVFVIVLFSTFLTMTQGGSANVLDFLNIPISILLGILVGILVGLLVWYVLHLVQVETVYKVILLLAVSFVLVTLEDALKGVVSISGLLAVMAMALTYKIKEKNVQDVSDQYGKLWKMAEIFLFVLVGAEVNIQYTFQAGIGAIAMILIALCIRSIGVIFSVMPTFLNNKEKLFCIFSYLPKATVQAAIGSVALSYGLNCGEIILSVAVLGILITAPLGAICMDASATKLLEKS